jgi:cytochrome c peroxidase
MRATVLVFIALLVSPCPVLAQSVGGSDVGFGPPPALAPGHAPPLPKPGPLAAPRSQDQVGLPKALTASVIPPSSPLAPAAVSLGEKLFFESRLSGDGAIACATCHDPARAFTDRRPTSIGIHGRVGQRNAPTILNALYNKTQFWDGRVNTLEQQAAMPITNPFEMGSPSIDAAASRIAGDKDYQEQFNQAYGRGVNAPDMLRAIAT